MVAEPELRVPVLQEDPHRDEPVVLKKAYISAHAGVDFVLGKDSQWWGPGYHGGLLLTNNAEPFTMVKVTNPSPVTLPWIFKYLGPFGFSFFLTQLEEQRAIPEPYLWGLRLDFRPHPLIEIGLERTALLGGEGRRTHPGDWIDSIIGIGNLENQSGEQNVGDQRAGFDVRVTIPWSVQPMQVYLEAAGEDEYNNHPNLWAFIGGVYFPRIASIEQVDLRVEYATTRGRVSTPYIWYVHGIYGSYSYNGDIIGHHMGTASEDWYLETSYRLEDPRNRISLFFDREQHDLYDTKVSRESKTEVGAGGSFKMTDTADLSLRVGRAAITNVDNLAGANARETEISMACTWRY